MAVWIAPSILAADFAALGEEVDDVMAAGADAIHFDVMDNHYVPNLTVGPLVLRSLRSRGSRAPVDVHLMVRPVNRLIDDFLAAGADGITIHPDADEDPAGALRRFAPAVPRPGWRSIRTIRRTPSRRSLMPWTRCSSCPCARVSVAKRSCLRRWRMSTSHGSSLMPVVETSA